MVQQHRHSYQRFFNTCSVSNTSAGYKNIQQTFFFFSPEDDWASSVPTTARPSVSSSQPLNLALQSRKQAVWWLCDPKRRSLRRTELISSQNKKKRPSNNNCNSKTVPIGIKYDKEIKMWMKRNVVQTFLSFSLSLTFAVIGQINYQSDWSTLNFLVTEQLKYVLTVATSPFFIIYFYKDSELALALMLMLALTLVLSGEFGSLNSKHSNSDGSVL